ncbi:hypothetical protein RJ640_024877, partial [Escallonia rubra]
WLKKVIARSRSPFTHRRGPNGKSYGELSSPDTDVSFVSSARPSIDRLFPSYGDSFEMGATPRLSNFSDVDRHSVESFRIGRKSADSTTPPELSYSSFDSDMSSPSQATDEVEAETRRLKLELKQTMDMYSTACKEAILAKQKELEAATSFRNLVKLEKEAMGQYINAKFLKACGTLPETPFEIRKASAKLKDSTTDNCLLRRSPTLSWQHRFRIAAEIGTGLLFLHQKKPEPLVHRDLKPANILLDRNYVSKISDVVLARLVPPSVADNVTQYRMTSTAQTFCYIDPEYQQTGLLGIKSDTYSLGIMFLQLITAKPPMGLTHHVEKAIERGSFAEMLDQTVPDWPVEEALSFAKMALKCAELRRKDRPDLGKVVMPELERLRALAEENMLHSTLYSAGRLIDPIFEKASSLKLQSRRLNSRKECGKESQVCCGFSLSAGRDVSSFQVRYTKPKSIPSARNTLKDSIILISSGNWSRLEQPEIISVSRTLSLPMVLGSFLSLLQPSRFNETRLVSRSPIESWTSTKLLHSLRINLSRLGSIENSGI